jgi:hypothetical protein
MPAKEREEGSGRSHEWQLTTQIYEISGFFKMSPVLVPLKSTYFLITLTGLSVIYGPGNWQQVAGYTSEVSGYQT